MAPAPPLPQAADDGPAHAAAAQAAAAPASNNAHPPPSPPPDGEGEEGLDIEDVLYSANSFWAVLKPVALTMFLAALVVVNVAFVSDDQGMSVYTINDGSTDDDGGGGGGGDSTSVKLGKSLANALTIVGVICAATFVVVLLYKFRCMKCLLAYMAFSCTMLLGLMGGLLWQTAMIKWELPCDYLTYIFVLYNFAVVGIAAIFYQKGIPTVVTQGYLVMISVIMAWQLSRFEEWTGWSLLVVLALYDLCAVLTPCGPLRYLVGLMQEYNEPMPGLLYEAELPAHAQHHRRRQPLAPTAAAAVTTAAPPVMGTSTVVATTATTPTAVEEEDEDAQRAPPSPLDPLLENVAVTAVAAPAGTGPPPQQQLQQRPSPSLDSRLLEEGTAEHHRIHQAGGAARGQQQQHQRQGSQHHHHHDGAHQERSIKLGLGDFVFYSVLVSKAALYGFATCAACFLVIIAGLGGTLVLLSVFKKALPALPLSIGLGVVFYLLTRVVIIPYLDRLLQAPLYV